MQLCFILALQSPIEYQKEKGGAGSSSSLTRNRSSSGNRPPASSHSRPSSAVGLSDKESERGRSQMKVSTSNGGSSCFDPRVSFYSLETSDGRIFLLFGLYCNAYPLLFHFFRFLNKCVCMMIHNFLENVFGFKTNSSSCFCTNIFLSH